MTERDIVYICDDNYLIPTTVSIQSLLANLDGGDHYRIHVCTFDDEDDDWDRLRGMDAPNAEILIHREDQRKYEDKYDGIVQRTYVTPTAMLKFEIADILPDSDEALYLDSDTVVNRPFNEIFDRDLEDHALGAVFDIVFDRALKKDPDHPEGAGRFYFNSGVMLLNLKEFRKRNISAALWEAKHDLVGSPDDVMGLMDQNAFNRVLADDCVPMPVRFNCPNQYLLNAGFDIGEVNARYGTDYRDTVDLWRDAVVIHYIGRVGKPWLSGPCACREIWDRYCRMAGISPEDLGKSGSGEKKSLGYCIGRTMELLKTRGFGYTERYVRYKLMMKMK